MRMINAFLVAATLALPVASVASAQDSARITVTGEGRVEAQPDMATIQLGVTTQAATAAEAMASNSAELSAVLDRLLAAGIEPRDVQTTGLSLNPNWDNSYTGEGAPKITGYVASNMLTVRVRAIETLGSVLDAAVKDGANTLNGVSFGLADPAPALDEARKLAVADALARATLFATAAGVALGPVISITEGGGYGAPVPMFKLEAARSDSVPVAAGEISTAASVTMVFGLGE